jgi:hypothetical protein
MSDSHGHTPAAWTAVIIMLIGFTISGVALPFALEWLFFVGLGVVALGAVVGKVMQMMGMGNTVAYKDDRDPEYGDETAPGAETAADKEQRDAVSSAEPRDDVRTGPERA